MIYKKPIHDLQRLNYWSESINDPSYELVLAGLFLPVKAEVTVEIGTHVQEELGIDNTWL